MTKKELLELIKDLKDDDSVTEVITESELANEFGSLDIFKKKIEEDKEFKSFMDSIKDKHTSKSLETWKQNNLEKLVNEKIKELYPKEDPKDLELRKLQQQMEEMQREAQREKLTNKAFKIATEKGLPTDLVDYFIGEDENSTLKNLETFEKTFTDNLETKVKERLKSNSYTPPSGENIETNSYESLIKNADKMTSEEVMEAFEKMERKDD